MFAKRLWARPLVVAASVRVCPRTLCRWDWRRTFVSLHGRVAALCSWELRGGCRVGGAVTKVSHVVLCHVMSCRVVSCRVVSRHLMLLTRVADKSFTLQLLTRVVDILSQCIRVRGLSCFIRVHLPFICITFFCIRLTRYPITLPVLISR